MINVFFDTEMTRLWDPLNPEPPGLISIGCVSEDGREFYAENADFQIELCSDFVHEVVLPLLEGGNKSMPYPVLAQRLREWVEGFRGADAQPEEVKFWTDAPGFDWPHVCDLFNFHGWPENLRRSPAPLRFDSSIKVMRFQAAVEDAFRTFKPVLRRHHALDDAIANRFGFLRAINRG